VNTTLREVFHISLPGLSLMVLTACGGSSSSPTPIPPTPMSASTYTIGGTVTGLTGLGLVLQNNAGEDLAVSAAGAFTFLSGFVSGGTYAVSVRVQPSSPAQNCVVTNGAGSIGGANVTDVTVECSIIVRFAYAANAGDNTVSVYSIDLTTGALSAVGTPVPTGTSPYAIAPSPDGRYVYVGNEGSNSISGYAVNATTGALTKIVGSPFAAGTDPQALAFASIPSGGTYLYVANNGSNTLSAYSVDASTGALTPLPTATYVTGSSPAAVSATSYGGFSYGGFVFVANNGGSNDISAFTITAKTGALTPVAGSPFAAGGNPHSLVLTPRFTDWETYDTRYLYTANFDGTSSVSGFLVDNDTGVLTPLSGSPFAIPVSNTIGTDGSGTYLYVTTGANVVGYGIDPMSGLLTALSGFPVGAGTNAYSVTVDPSNQFLYVGNDGAATISGYTLDPGTGGLTAVPGSPFAAGNQPDFIATL